MEEIIGVLNDIVWSDALIFLCLGTGVFFHKNTFCRYVILGNVCLLFDGKSSESELSSIINVIGR
jgi:AGCS family alanine or glycine:cation symporter